MRAYMKVHVCACVYVCMYVCVCGGGGWMCVQLMCMSGWLVVSCES